MPDMNMMGGGMPQRPDNQEAAMARADLYKSANYSFKLFKMIQDGQELEGWVQAKITKAADYIASVYHYMEYEMKFNEYGKNLQDSDVYTESVKQKFIEKLTEARVKMEKLKEKNIRDLDEGWDDMMKAVKDKAGAQPNGGSGVKKGKAYGGADSDKKAPKPEGGKAADAFAKKHSKSTKESVDKSQVPAALRKAKGGDWKVSKADLDKEASKSPTSKAGLEKRKQELGMKEALKGGQKKLDVDKDGKLEKSDFAKLRAGKDVKEASHQAKTTMKHVKNPTAGEKQAAKDIKPGVAGYRDRVAMLKSAEKDGRLKEAAKPDFLDMDKDGDKKEPMKKAIADKKVKEAAKPDFLDMDKDGNKKEPMKKAVADKKKMPFGKK